MTTIFRAIYDELKAQGALRRVNVDRLTSTVEAAVASFEMSHKLKNYGNVQLLMRGRAAVDDETYVVFRTSNGEVFMLLDEKFNDAAIK